jgi:hypothetical protein
MDQERGSGNSINPRQSSSFFVSIQEALTEGPENSVSLNDVNQSESPTKSIKQSTTPTSTKSWWNSDQNLKNIKPLNDHSQEDTLPPIPKEKKRLSIFDRILGVGDSTSSANLVGKSIPELNNSNISISVTVENNDNVETGIFKEGHILHELIPNLLREAGIDDDITDIEEYADRFTIETDSSDDVSKSEISTMGDGKTIFSRRSNRIPGQRTSMAPAPIKKPEISPLTKSERIKRTDKNSCKLCSKEYDPKFDKLFMCQHCHMVLHAGCMDLIECHPCEMAFSEDKIDSAFFKIFTSLLKHYRAYLKISGSPDRAGAIEDMNTWFKRSEFLSEFDGETKVIFN